MHFSFRFIKDLKVHENKSGLIIAYVDIMKTAYKSNTKYIYIPDLFIIKTFEKYRIR